MDRNFRIMVIEDSETQAVKLRLLLEEQGWEVAVEGTRGLIRFSRPPGISVWQWAWPPTQVVDRDPAQPDRFRVLTTS